MTRVHRFVPEAAPRKDDANRWLNRAHGADLSWRRVSTEEAARLTQVERVPEISRWVILGDIEELEVRDVILDLLPLRNRKTE